MSRYLPRVVDSPLMSSLGPASFEDILANSD